MIDREDVARSLSFLVLTSATVIRERMFYQPDLSIQEGEFVTLVGPSGCGKSTLLRLIIGQERVGSGEIILSGSLSGPCPKRGVVFQNYSLFPHLTVLENVILSKKLGLSRWAWRNLRREAEEEICCRWSR